MALILIWSVITNLVAILAIMILYVRQNRLIHAEKNMRVYTEDLENAITVFLLEMKEENESLKTAFLENGSSKEEKVDVREGLVHGTGDSAEQKKQAVPAGESENFLLLQVLRLKRQGKSIEEIAKEMGKGKTEIELLIKMNE